MISLGGKLETCLFEHVTLSYQMGCQICKKYTQIGLKNPVNDCYRTSMVQIDRVWAIEISHLGTPSWGVKVLEQRNLEFLFSKIVFFFSRIFQN